MPNYLQNDRGLEIETPLGNDALLVKCLRGTECISRLFQFDLDLLAEAAQEVPFDQLIGQHVTVTLALPDEASRHFRGIVKSLTQGSRSRISQQGQEYTFVSFQAELVPHVWLLTRKVQSRIFQHLSTPDILRRVFSGFQVEFQLMATYSPRDYCVQYDESDFAFASRLMEEEGIYYYFTHSSDGPEMILADGATYPDIEGLTSVAYQESSSETHQDVFITAWEKRQELGPSTCLLWDHCFELPGRNLEAKEKATPSLKVGRTTHKLDLGDADGLSIYRYPGGYARRFDGVSSNGTPEPLNLRAIFEDGQRSALIGMQQEESASIEIRATGNRGSFIPAHLFTLQGHFDADDQYLLTSVEHCAKAAGYGNASEPGFSYENRFTCIPAALPYRPQPVTSKPTVGGIQTATIVGPPGEELFCDKYGRVKVQFHWDRDGKLDANSSCWLRVAQVWAGSNWGACFWPRVGHEVLVAFEDSDPDQPVIIGSLYNADNMPPFEMPASSHLAGFKSATIRGKAYKNFNGVVFDDTNGHEHLALHSERHMSFNSEFDKIFHAGRHKGERVSGSNIFTVGTLPGSGGSGGGSNPAWPKPYPQGVLGLNAAMVYGENMQAVVGTNHQLALGNNFQICINPAGLMMCSDSLAEVPFFAEALSSGIGGNMQLTVGTSAQLVYGQNIEIDAGMPKLELHRDSSTTNALSYGMVAVIGCLVAAYTLAYGLLDKDFQRAVTTLTFQACLDVLLTILMMIELETKQVDESKAGEPPDAAAAAFPFSQQVDKATDRLREKARTDLMGHAKHINWTMEDMGEFMGSEMRISPSATGFFEALSVVLGVVILPLVLIAEHEKDPENALKQNSSASK